MIALVDIEIVGHARPSTHIADDIQIRQAVIVYVAPHPGDNMIVCCHTHCYGDVGERAIAIISKQGIITVFGHVKIEITIAIKVCNRAANAAID